MKQAPPDSAGFTLIELIVVITVSLILLGGIFTILNTNQRALSENREQVRAQQTVRAGLQVLLQELREVSPALGDVLLANENQLQVRVPEGLGLVCLIDTRDPLRVIARRMGRSMQVGETVTFFVDDDPTRVDDDFWALGQISAATDTGACPGGGLAQTLTITSLAPLGAELGLRPGAAIRAFSTWTFGPVTHDGETYLGRTGTSGGGVPLVGPLDPVGGIRFLYRDGGGNVTGNLTSIRSLEATLKVTTPLPRRQGGMVADSLTATLHFRN
jgi:prepilin-type N-terminal cleavage/methylation domain-containing protein